MGISVLSSASAVLVCRRIERRSSRTSSDRRLPCRAGGAAGWPRLARLSCFAQSPALTRGFVRSRRARPFISIALVHTQQTSGSRLKNCMPCPACCPGALATNWNMSMCGRRATRLSPDGWISLPELQEQRSSRATSVVDDSRHSALGDGGQCRAGVDHEEADVEQRMVLV